MNSERAFSQGIESDSNRRPSAREACALAAVSPRPSCNILNPNQSGFRHCDSTINQLISITREIFRRFDCNPPLDVRSMFLDISKAFDRVWHDRLIYKLKRCGSAGELLFLIVSFLDDRKQRSVLNGQCSSWGDTLVGVPQGSVLGPLLFLLYIKVNFQ